MNEMTVVSKVPLNIFTIGSIRKATAKNIVHNLVEVIVVRVRIDQSLAPLHYMDKFMGRCMRSGSRYRCFVTG